MSAHHACHSSEPSPCHGGKGKVDWLFSLSFTAVVVLYLSHLLMTAEEPSWFQVMAEANFELLNRMWWGVLLGILMLALLSRVPREFVMSAMGAGKGLRGIIRATAAGVLLDLCSHGILMVGAKLYERGARCGQVMAFLIASPWNSFSLTLVLIALIGFWWTLLFILLSMLIAIITGLLFDFLVEKSVLPENPNRGEIPDGFRFWPQAYREIKKIRLSPGFILKTLWQGIKESRMVLRWLFFGLLLASILRALLPLEHFQSYFGPSLMGLGITVLVATVVEVCSEGSAPIAADILTQAGAPGNSFAFLMTGVSTDYTEIMVLKEATRSLKLALFLPLLTVPQVLLAAWLINAYAI